MAGTRRSARQAGKNDSSPSASQSKPMPAIGSKRKADSAPNSKAKRGRKGRQKEQASIEDSMAAAEENGESKDVEMKDEQDNKSEEAGDAVDEVVKREEDIRDQEDMDEGMQEEKTDGKEARDTNGASKDDGKDETKQEEKTDEKEARDTNGTSKDDGKDETKNGFDAIMDQGEKDADKNITADGTGSKVSQGDNAVEESSKREEAVPSNILEKGIIYFFFRGRVGIDEPSDVNEIARSYIILRPVPQGSKLGEGPIGDDTNVRMLSLPKKVLPVSPKDRFMTFVEKTKTTMEDVKQQLSSSEYATKTAGTRHTPAAAPVGEGVYAITQTGRETHLAYILTIPSEISEVQKGIGLRQRGSYFTSAKNPTTSAPANASLPQGPDYPKEVLDEFSGRGWMPLKPHLLDYENAQFLIIGHHDDALEKAAKPQDGEDQKPEKETPLEEIEKLEHEDHMRVQHLEGDDTVFTDLGLSVKEYPKVQTTW